MAVSMPWHGTQYPNVVLAIDNTTSSSSRLNAYDHTVQLRWRAAMCKFNSPGPELGTFAARKAIVSLGCRCVAQHRCSAMPEGGHWALHGGHPVPSRMHGSLRQGMWCGAPPRCMRDCSARCHNANQDCIAGEQQAPLTCCSN